jgi:hypothetical protein
MNPKTTIVPWLLAIGKQFGISEVHEYQWDDVSARQHQPYFTYEILSYKPVQKGLQSKNTKTGYDATFSAWQAWKVRASIKVFNSENGLYELGAASIAAQHHLDIRKLFKAHGGVFCECLEIVNNTTVDGERAYYEMEMTCEFNSNVEYSLSSTNAIVDEINVTIDITE